jgi:hypothetical protein
MYSPLNISNVRWLLLVSCIWLIGACGGGGGSGSEQSASGGDACGALNLKVINGDSCSFGSNSPVALLITPVSGSVVQVCTGTLITPTKILTAAHCFESGGVTQVTVGGQTMTLASRRSSPQYNGSAGSPFDIAIGTLPRAVTSAVAVPIITSSYPPSGSELTVYGFGATEKGDNIFTRNNLLNAAGIEVVSANDGGILSLYRLTNTSICIGDSGGPALYNPGSGIGITGVSSAVTASSASVDPTCKEDGTESIFASVKRAENLAFIRANAAGVVER